MDVLSLDTQKIALVVLNLEAFTQKARNSVETIKDEFAQLRPQSDQTQKFHKVMEKEMEDIETNIGGTLKSMSGAAAELRQSIESLENSDEIFAAARASMTESANKGKARPKLG